MSKNRTFLESQTDKYKYQNFLKNNIYLGSIGFPLNTDLADTSLKHLQAELRDLGYKQETITKWFYEVKKYYNNDDRILGVEVDGEHVFVFLSELPSFKEQLWRHHYGKISLNNYVQFISDKIRYDALKEKREQSLTEEELYMEGLLNLVSEVDVLEEFITHQLYAKKVDKEKLEQLKQEVISETNTNT